MATLDTLEIKTKADPAPATSGLDRLTQALDKLSNKLESVSAPAKKTEEAVKSAGKAAEKGGASASKGSSGFSKLAETFKRMVTRRAIMAVIRGVTEAFSDGIKRMYEWSQANDKVFSKAMDTFATEKQYLNDSVGAMVAPLIESVMPIFEKIVDMVVEAINYVQMFFRALNGESTYLRAVKQAKSYGDALGTAAKNQKELNNQLMSFDELNLITTPKSGGSSNETSPAQYVEEFIPAGLAVLADKFSPVIEAAKKGLEKLEPIIKSIWEKVLWIWDHIDDTFFGTLINGTNEVFEMVQGIGEIVDGILTAVQGILSMDFNKTISGVREALVGVLRVIGNIIFSVLNSLAGIIDTIAESTGWYDTFAVDAVAQGEKAFNEWLDDIVDETKRQATSAERIVEGTTGSIGDMLMHKTAIWGNEIENKFGNVGATAGSNFADSFTSAAGNIRIGVDIEYPQIGAYSNLDFQSDWTKNYNNQLGIVKSLANYTGGGGLGAGRKFASGGFPDMGSVFVAGEVPGQTEMVGTINGRTGVASGQEITGIADAVRESGSTEASLLRQLISIVANNGGITPSASLGKVIAQSTRMYREVTG